MTPALPPKAKRLHLLDAADANGGGMPDDPLRPARDAILLPLATTLKDRLEAGGPVDPWPTAAWPPRRLTSPTRMG